MGISTYLFIYLIPILFSNAAQPNPWILQNYGPLYDGIQLLLDYEALYVNSTGNVTVQQLESTLQIMQNKSTQLSAAEDVVVTHLKALNVTTQSGQYKQCYSKHVREIAHFNRELLSKAAICKRALNEGLERLRNRTNELIETRNGTATVYRMGRICNVAALKRNNTNQANVVLCVVASVGELNLRLLDDTQLGLDIIADIALSSGNGGKNDDGMDSCEEFEHLKLEFDGVYEKIQACIADS